MIVNNILFIISGFMIFWAMVGYPLSIKLLGIIYRKKKNTKNYNLVPSVTVIIVAHNEEKVIKDKLINVCNLNYPIDKLKIIVSSDNSTDQTNNIVKKFINENPNNDVTLYEVKKRMGKTNAQNEAQKYVTTEFIVMTDANAFLEENSVLELMASFVSEDIAYVTGCLRYINVDKSQTANNEGSYWDSDVSIREIESNIKTITAGNGALYACRNKDYYDFDPIECHDSSMPYYYALHNKRAVNCMEAVAYEKAGENDQDEFKRKVRMNRMILRVFKNSFKVINIFKYGWFTYFYFGHRTCRYLLWLNHMLFFITNIINMNLYLICKISFIAQLAFYIIYIYSSVFSSKNKLIRLVKYYGNTVLAQWFGVFNILTGKVKPTWEKAESTR